MHRPLLLHIGPPDCIVAPGLALETALFLHQPQGCTPAASCTGVRALLLGGSRTPTIADGALLYTCRVSIGAAAAGDVALPCSGAVASGADAGALPTECTSGTVHVVQ